ncbi:MAG: DUF6440 family protein [Clostridia bacterium]|nr:DUF6440 family protein [Clostridia bacterium]
MDNEKIFENDRFIIVYEQEDGILSVETKKILVDKVTGVNYLFIKAGYGAGITPLLDENGKPIVTKNIE